MSWFNRKKLVNSESTSKKTILSQMHEPRPLPMGQKEFMEWSDRIISGALIPCTEPESLRGILCTMLIALPGTESHKPDAYFIHSLRKAAVNEVANANFQAIKGKRAEAAKFEADKVKAEQTELEARRTAKEAQLRQDARESNLIPK